MFRCHYACTRCDDHWFECWDEIQSDVCDICERRSMPYYAKLQQHSPLLATFLADRNHQLKLFGDDNA